MVLGRNMVSGVPMLVDVASVRLLFFVSFFVGTAVAYRFRDRFHVRRLHVGTLLVTLLLVNVVGIGLVPAVKMHKFPTTGPEEETVHEFRMVDEDGNELLLDTRAVDPMPPTRVSEIGRYVVHRYDEDTRREVASFVFEEAREYRRARESSGTVGTGVEYPRHEYGFEWTPELLAEYDRFVAVRVYEVEITMSEDGTEIASKSATQQYEYRPSTKSQSTTSQSMPA